MTATPDPTNVFMETARTKLHRICGVERGEALLHDALRACGMTELRSAEEMYRISGYFLEKGGFLEAVGHALRFQARLHGAKSG